METTNLSFLGVLLDNGKMEATAILGLYRVCIGIMESRMETTIILGLYRVLLG